jgi:hypothetical protein
MRLKLRLPVGWSFDVSRQNGTMTTLDVVFVEPTDSITLNVVTPVGGPGIAPVDMIEPPFEIWNEYDVTFDT